jgi:pimeloyl-ACP methyl ester carboxylesterase
MEAKSHRIRGSHGLELHVLEWSQEGVPLVLLHGLGNEAHLWDDFVPAVAPHYRVLALDQRGHGDSDWDPEARYDAESMTDDLESVLRAFDIDRLVLVGFSMGGRVAMTFAGRHPERLAGLVSTLHSDGRPSRPRSTLEPCNIAAPSPGALSPGALTSKLA